MKELDDLARTVVGDGKGPNAFFVSVEGTVLAVLSVPETLVKFFGAPMAEKMTRQSAIAFARAVTQGQRFSKQSRVIVEDRSEGTVWQNWD